MIHPKLKIINNMTKTTMSLIEYSYFETDRFLFCNNKIAYFFKKGHFCFF
jgi:hypothetical protein